MSHGERSTPVGTWELVSVLSERSDGPTFEPFGPRPSGRITYDEAGHVTAMIVGEQRNEATGQPCSPEARPWFTAYFGTYRVDAGRGEITHLVATSLNGTTASGELRRHYKFEHDNLLLWFSQSRDGVEVTNRLVWRRISPR